MSRKPNLYLVPPNAPKAVKQNVDQVNRADVYSGDIVAFVACLSFDARDSGVPFDSIRLAAELRAQLTAFAGRVPDETFLKIASICGELLNDGAEAVMADHLASMAVANAKKGKK